MTQFLTTTLPRRKARVPSADGSVRFLRKKIMSDATFRPSTVFFLLFSVEQPESFYGEVSALGCWDTIPSERLATRYLLRYAARIAEDPSLFRCFELKTEAMPCICLHGTRFSYADRIRIDEIRPSQFATGIGFLEFHVFYDGLSLSEISDFAYRFKRVAQGTPAEGEQLLLEAAKLLLPTSVSFFFEGRADFKKECLCFHRLCLNENSESEESLDRMLCLLRRSYAQWFRLPCDDSDYDMRYDPYPDDRWAGSQEGLVNLNLRSGNEEDDWFLNHFKFNHLAVDYHFLYLLLLNQRFSAIRYITEIAECGTESRRKLEKLNRKIVRLKTVFSFNVISDDQIYQNVYARLYRILDIDRLLADIRDNEEQMEILQNTEAVKADQTANKFLFGISLLSLFSALIDAAGYFDRFPGLQAASTWVSLACVIAIILLCIGFLIRDRNK
jgi:hypothetical protein